MEKLKISTAIQIARPVNDVFEAILEPDNMSNYFIAESSGRMEEGKTLQWKFPEFDEWVEIEVVEITTDEYISFQWEGSKDKKLLVEITLLPMNGNSTLARVTEGEMEPDETGIKWLAQNTEGWANFLACLKAYLEHGINLRKGAFEFLKVN
ncbi:SRPBCC domain-containing protein [Salinimicrobium flavum]|uniref:SRPBCC domain-containing protein n=1 Tax=Salinimicrobium flavum TaxID=1737065 RepID=A0ABW5IVW1_9FLAO